jgi:hypothetical protein
MHRMSKIYSFYPFVETFDTKPALLVEQETFIEFGVLSIILLTKIC